MRKQEESRDGSLERINSVERLEFVMPLIECISSPQRAWVAENSSPIRLIC